jgi:hypothetical protein
VTPIGSRASPRPRRHAGTALRGIQHYAGQVMHVAGYDRRREKSLRLWEPVEEVVAL